MELEPLAKPVSMNKQYTTQDGAEVRIYATDAGGPYPVHGACKNANGWNPIRWSIYGEPIMSALSNKALREVPADKTIRDLTVGEILETLPSGVSASVADGYLLVQGQFVIISLRLSESADKLETSVKDILRRTIDGTS